MRSTLLILTLMGLGLMSGCGADSGVAVTTVETIQVTEESTPTASATLAVRPLTPEAQVINLVVWLPDLISPPENPDAEALLNAQFRGFEASEPGLQITFRRKRYQDLGGIISTLRTASAVAPGALPDLTLLRRDDMITAAQTNLIKPLEGRITTGVISGLNPHAIELGSVNSELFGMPYMLETLMVAYQENPARELTPAWSFETLLKNRLKFAFPAGRTGGISDVFYIQYLAAGGTPPSDGVMDLNESALLTTLTFYEQAREVGLIDANILSYTTLLDYETLLNSSSIDAGAINSSSYARLQTVNTQLDLAFIPTSTGTPKTLLNGWMWVITTDDTDRQALTGRLVNWMMDSSRQGEYASLIGMIPSETDALKAYPFAMLETPLLLTLLQNAAVPLTENDAGTVGRVMQNALAAVLRGESTAEEATRDVVNQLSG